MFILYNKTPYAAGRNWIRDQRGMHVWVVAVKATFDIAPNGGLTLADEQPPPILAPVYRGDPNESSLRFESDLLTVKPTTDILVDACAYAPRGRPATTVPVSLRIGDLEKTLVVHGMRVHYKGAVGMTTSAPRPFVTQPIEYEWAFGGKDLSDSNPLKHRIDMRNPVGKGFAVNERTLEDQPAHAIEYPRGNPANTGPAGYGPVTSFWSPRLEQGGTYDAAWERTRKPLLPDDYDPSHAQAAPEDQQPRQPLRGGEPVLVQNMTQEGRLLFQLPTVVPTFRTHLAGRTEKHAARLATVYLALEQKKLMMVWQTSLPVRAREFEYLDGTEIGEAEASQ